MRHAKFGTAVLLPSQERLTGVIALVPPPSLLHGCSLKDYGMIHSPDDTLT